VIHAGRRLSDRERAARKGAALGQAEKHFGPLAGTGLAKLCSRCERVGWVFERIGHGFIVVWEGAGHRPDRPDMSQLTDHDLVSPDFGCLYCHPVTAGASEARPREGSSDEDQFSVL
jgi:hypothetical protein